MQPFRPLLGPQQTQGGGFPGSRMRGPPPASGFRSGSLNQRPVPPLLPPFARHPTDHFGNRSSGDGPPDFSRFRPPFGMALPRHRFGPPPGASENADDFESQSQLQSTDESTCLDSDEMSFGKSAASSSGMHSQFAQIGSSRSDSPSLQDWNGGRLLPPTTTSSHLGAMQDMPLRFGRMLPPPTGGMQPPPGRLPSTFSSPTGGGFPPHGMNMPPPFLNRMRHPSNYPTVSDDATSSSEISATIPSLLDLHVRAPPSGMLNLSSSMQHNDTLESTEGSDGGDDLDNEQSSGIPSLMDLDTATNSSSTGSSISTAGPPTISHMQNPLLV